MGEIKDKQQRLENAVDAQRLKFTQYHSYTEDEMFTMEGESVFSVLDFWRYTYGALESLQDAIAEFLVSRALGIDKAENSLVWTGYDMSYRSKRVEVKASSYVHFWNKNKTSEQRSFSIAPTSNYYWFGNADRDGKELSRQNELYVFCLNTNRDTQNNNPLRIDDWDFYVVPTFLINERCELIGNPNQKTISIGVVKRIAGGAVKWSALRQKIDSVIEQIDQRVVKMDNE